MDSNEILKKNVEHQTTESTAKISNPKIQQKSSSCSSPSNSPSSFRNESIDQENQTSLSSYPYVLSASTIPGVLNAQNSGAIDWSQNGMLAYGCQNRVIIVDTKPSLSFRQTLHRHKQTISLVKWSPLTNHLCLCSIDTIGMIIVWDVIESTPLTVILSTNENKSVNFFHWIHLDRTLTVNKNQWSSTSKPQFSCWDLQQKSFENKSTEFNEKSITRNDCKSDNVSSCLATNLFLLTFYQHTNTIIVYDADLGDPVTKLQINYSISSVLFNPFFKFDRCCDSSVQNLLLNLKPLMPKDDRIYLGLARLDEHFLQNDHTSKEPHRIHLSLNVYMIQKEKSLSHYDSIIRLDRTKHSKHLIPINDLTIQSINDSQSTTTTNNNNTNDHQKLIQIEFHKSVRNQIFLVFAREIYLIDLSIETIITIIPIERNFSKLIKIFSCSLRNAFYALHENGNVSFRLYQKKVIRDNPTSETDNMENKNDQNQFNFLNIGYVNLCHSEPIRLTKQNKIYGYSLSPFDETKIVFLLSTGKILFKSLICQKFFQNDTDQHHSTEKIILPCLDDLIKPKEYKLGAFLVNQNNDNHQDVTNDNEDPYKNNENKTFESITYKIIITHYLSGLNNIPTVIKMSPALTLQNLHQHKPLLAVGDSLGIVQIWLLNNGTIQLHRELCAHSYAIAGIEWANLHSLITFSYPSINSPAHNYTMKHPLSALQNTLTGGGGGSSSGKVTNELIHIDIQTGKLTPFRTNHITDSSPIETIRVSHLKQYLIVLFKRDDPFEIWDVKTLTLLRVMSKSIGLVTAVEWNPLYNRKQFANKNSLEMQQASDSDSGSIGSNSKFHPVYIKENFIVTSKELFHFSIEGNIVRELARIPSDVEGGHITVTSIAWKSDQVLFGDASGTLNLWDLKRKNSRTESTYRSSIRKVRFGPGRGNMKCLILYADFGVDIWDINEFRLCSQLKYPRDINFKIIDIDWASCDLPIFATTDGFIFITDQKLKTYSSPLNLERLCQSQKIFLDENNDIETKSSSFLEFLEDLNVNYLSFEMRKILIRKFMFEIPLKSCQVDGDDTIQDDTTTKAIDDNNGESESETIVDFKQYINNQKLMAKLFSNQNDYDFWSLVSSILLTEELDTRMDLFLDNQQFRQLLQEKLMILENTRRTYFHACQVYKLNLSLKNFQRAVQILLESETLIQAGRLNQNNDSVIDSSLIQNGTGYQTFYLDALKACLIAALQTNEPNNNLNKRDLLMTKTIADDCSIDNYSLSLDNDADLNSMNHITTTDQSDNSNSTSVAILNETKVAPVVKLVATSLIANGHIDEGVELLTIISKTSDACRYLQSSDKWLDSIWLAKSTLDGNECTEIMRRWCEYLISSRRYQDRQTAMKIYLSRKQFSRILRSFNQYFESKTFPLAVVIIAAQLIDIEANMDCLEDIFYKFVEFFFNIEDRNHLLKQMNEYQTTNNAKLRDQKLEILQKCWKLFFQQK